MLLVQRLISACLCLFNIYMLYSLHKLQDYAYCSAHNWITLLQYGLIFSCVVGKSVDYLKQITWSSKSKEVSKNYVSLSKSPTGELSVFHSSVYKEAIRVISDDIFFGLVRLLARL